MLDLVKTKCVNQTELLKKLGLFFNQKLRV
jgi:hypothetical protein